MRAIPRGWPDPTDAAIPDRQARWSPEFVGGAMPAASRAWRAPTEAAGKKKRARRWRALSGTAMELPTTA